MKKLLTLAFITLFSLTATAQDEATEDQSRASVKISLDLGSTAGDGLTNKLYNLNVGFNFNYLYDLTKDLKIGAAAGIKTLMEDDSFDKLKNRVDSDKAYLSLGVEMRLYTDNDKFYLGADTGIAAGLFNKEDNFYYRPKLGFVLSECSGVFVSFTEVLGDGNSFSTVNLGYEFSF